MLRIDVTENQITRRRAIQTIAAGANVLAIPAAKGQQSTGPILIAGRSVEVAVTLVSTQTIRLTAQLLENGAAVPIAADGSLVKSDWGRPAVQLRSLTAPQILRHGELTVRLSNEPFTVRCETGQGRLVQELKCDRATGVISFLTGDRPVFGLGQGGPQFDRRGNVDRMVSGQGGYQLRTHGAKVPIPFIVGAAGWGMFVHSPMAAFDLTGTEARIQPADVGSALPIDIFIITAKEPASIMTEYAKITGYPEMAPLWAFGYQQSHRTLGTPEETMQEAKIFREKKMPCDAMIYLGTDFCPNGWNTHNGEFTWNPNAFPDPTKAIQQLHDEHFKVVLHIVIEGHHLTGKVSDPCTVPVPSGRTPDGHWPPERQVSCYWPYHKPLFDQNVDGWWPDQGDGLDPASRLARNRMYFEGSLMYRPNERVYALHRNGYAGMQRYASFLWSGDVQSTWETLKTHVPVAINAGLSGVPFWGTDIGGFVPTQEYTGELFARWFQFATFNPLFRSHGRDWRLHLPWGWTNGQIGYQETPTFHPDPKDLDNPEIEPICKKYLELRYRLMPYLYSAVKETCETGMPIIRALWLHYPQDETAVARGDEYLFGRDLLVAPVVEKGAESRSVYLPHGSWYDFWTHERIDGGRTITKSVDLGTIPLYIRAGAILPFGPVKQYTGEKVDEPVSLLVHPGANGAFSLYSDDGKTFNYRRGEFERVEISWNDSSRRLYLSLAAGSRMLQPKLNLVVQRIGDRNSQAIAFQGKPLQLAL
jgi:alpha-glucosidase/alpha-D-xyloside xylohydrolase